MLGIIPKGLCGSCRRKQTAFVVDTLWLLLFGLLVGLSLGLIIWAAVGNIVGLMLFGATLLLLLGGVGLITLEKG